MFYCITYHKDISESEFITHFQLVENISDVYVFLDTYIFIFRFSIYVRTFIFRTPLIRGHLNSTKYIYTVIINFNIIYQNIDIIKITQIEM